MCCNTCSPQHVSHASDKSALADVFCVIYPVNLFFVQVILVLNVSSRDSRVYVTFIYLWERLRHALQIDAKFVVMQ